MKLSNRKDSNGFWVFVLKIVVALFVIQLIRAAIMGGLWYAVKPGNNLAIFQALNGISFIIVGLILLMVFKPSLKDLSLDWQDIRLRTKILYIVAGLILVSMIVLPIFLKLDQDIIVMGFVFGLIVPAFEELLFRGYIWNKIENHPEMNQNSLFIKRRGLCSLVIVTLLFGIWHLGYVDVFLIHPKINPEGLTTLLMAKFGIGIILGAIVGFIRLKTGKVYGSFLFHGFWNVFAP